MGTTAGVRSVARAHWLTRQAPDMALASRRGVAQRRGCLLGQRPGTGRRALATPLCFPRRVSASPSAHNQQHAYEMSRPDYIDILRPQPNKNMTACTKVPNHQLQPIKFNNSPATHRAQLIEAQPDLLIQVTIIPSMLNDNAALQLNNNNAAAGRVVSQG